MSTIQINANRANAQLSSGPRTEEGKAIASLNSLRHGLTGNFLVLPNEDQEAYHLLVKKLRWEYEPRAASEDILIEGMAQHHWLVQRSLRLQNEIFGTKDLSDPAVQRQLALYIRYQTTNERAFHCCRNEFLKLRKVTGCVENGFVSHNRRDGMQRTKPVLRFVSSGPNQEAANQRFQERYDREMDSYQHYLADKAANEA